MATDDATARRPGYLHDVWLLRYIVTAETAALVMMVTFYATGYQNLVSTEDLKNLPYPYVPDKTIISTHIRKSEIALDKINTALHNFNLRMTKESHEKDLRIQILETDLQRRMK